MLYETRFRIELAARNRGAIGLGFRRLSPLQRSTSPASHHSPLFACPPPLIPARTNRESPVASHRFLIVTLELEFPLTPTKQKLRNISNRHKMRFLHPGRRSGTPFSHPGFAGRNRSGAAATSLQAPASSLQNLIANPRLEFFLNSPKSINYNFLIANRWRFFLTFLASSRIRPASATPVFASNQA